MVILKKKNRSLSGLRVVPGHPRHHPRSARHCIYRKVGHRQRLPVWWYIPMYMGRIRVDIMHFLVGSTPCKMLQDVGIWCNTLGCMIHAQLMLHCVTSFLLSVLFLPSLHLHFFCRKFSFCTFYGA